MLEKNRKQKVIIILTPTSDLETCSCSFEFGFRTLAQYVC